MSNESNKALVRRFYEEVIAKRNANLVDELCAPDYTYHFLDVPPNLPRGLEGFKRFVGEFLSGYDQLQFTIEDQIAEGDKVATRLTARSSTAIGPLKSNPENPQTASNASTITAITMERIANNKIVESWTQFDLSGEERQLGIMPQIG